MRSADGRQSGVKVTRTVRDVPPSPYWKTFRDGLRDEPYERWFDYDFVLPGTLLMDSTLIVDYAEALAAPRKSLMPAGLVWGYDHPPVLGLAYEMDVRAVARELLL